MHRRELLALLAAVVPLTASASEAGVPEPAAYVEDGDEEKVEIDPFGAKIVAIDDRKRRVVIEGDLEGLRILVTDELGNLVFPKWTYAVEDGRVVITFTSPVGFHYEGQIYLSFIDFRGLAREVNLTWS